jgi:hypothetical protein
VKRGAWIGGGAGAGLALCAWLGPAVLAWSSLAEQSRRFGVDVELSGIRPIWPLGFRADAAAVHTPDASLELAELRTEWRPSGLLGTARLGAGRLELRSSLRARSALLFARGVPIESMELTHAKGVALRGSLTGVASWESHLRFSARIRGASVTWLGGLLRAPLEHVAVLGEWIPEEQRTRIEELEAFGASFNLTGSGEISALGELRLRLEVQRVEERLLRALPWIGLPVPERFPARYLLVGPWPHPHLERLP